MCHGGMRFLTLKVWEWRWSLLVEVWSWNCFVVAEDYTFQGDGGLCSTSHHFQVKHDLVKIFIEFCERGILLNIMNEI